MMRNRSRTIASPLRLLSSLTLLSSLGGCATSNAPTATSPTVDKSAAHPYAAVADQIIDAVLENNGAWAKLEALCDGIGHRLSGSPQLDLAIEWATGALKADGHDNVRAEPVMVPKWVRGRESVRMILPRPMALPMLGLGGSIGTPPGGLTAEVVVAADEAALEALGSQVEGRIVLFDNPMPDWSPDKGSGYGTTVRFRSRGPRLAGALGAVGVLVRSVTAHSLRSPHTGATSYRDVTHKLPAAAITTEDAAMIARMRARGETVKVHLQMEARTEPDAPSANVVAELRGSQLPDEIVVIGGHLDSWDVGQGAHDDGAGCVIAMEALTALKRLGLRPRRTIRVVLWTNEENGLGGAKAYAKDHASELANHVAAIESDSGAFDPRGFGIDLGDDDAEARAVKDLERLLPLLERLGPQKASPGFGGADVSVLKPAGVPTLGLSVEGSRYFDYHHTHADTLDKVDPMSLSKGVAAMAAMAYILADMPGRLGAQPATPTGTAGAVSRTGGQGSSGEVRPGR